MSDLISRQDAIDECDKQYPNIDRQDFKAVINAVPSADAVQIPIKLEKRYPQSRDEDITDAFMRGYLAGRSSADRPTGKWEIKTETDEYGLKRPKLVCSKCEKEPAAWDLTELFEFCPNCGSRNVREDGDTE